MSSRDTFSIAVVFASFSLCIPRAVLLLLLQAPAKAYAYRHHLLLSSPVSGPVAGPLPVLRGRASCAAVFACQPTSRNRRRRSGPRTVGGMSGILPPPNESLNPEVARRRLYVSGRSDNNGRGVSIHRRSAKRQRRVFARLVTVCVTTVKLQQREVAVADQLATGEGKCVLSRSARSALIRTVGTGPADPAAAGPII